MSLTRIIYDDEGVCPGESCQFIDPEMAHRHEARHLYNAKVRIFRDAEDGTTRLVVNDQDLSMSILAEGFGVTFDEGEAHIAMTLATDDYEIDLPDAEVEVK